MSDKINNNANNVTTVRNLSNNFDQRGGAQTPIYRKPTPPPPPKTKK